MEEMIDFDEWIKNYKPPEIEFYAIYNPDSFEVVGVYPTPAANTKEHKIKIDRELAEDIQNGIVKMSSCFVNLETNSLEILEKHPLRKIDDILHRIIDKKYSDVEDNDITVKFKNKKIIFEMSKKLANRKIKWKDDETINFFITSYNDPHVVYKNISIKLDNLYKEPQEFICDLENKFSIYTRRIFKNYVFELL